MESKINETAKSKILVVDDDLITAISLKKLLEKQGYEIIGPAGKAAEALELVNKFKPHLAIMDINLRDQIDGVELSERIKKITDIPIIFVTAYSDDSTFQRAMKTDPYHYLIKPFNNRELSLAVEMSLYKHSLAMNIKESEEKYRTLFENLTEGVFYQNKDGRLIDVNASALNLFGMARDEFLKRTAFDGGWAVIDSDGVEIGPDKYPSNKALSTGESVTGFELAVFNPVKNGYVWLSVNATPQFQDGETEPYQVFVSLHDITERKESQLALIENEKKMRSIVEGTPQLFFYIQDAKAKSIYVSPTIEQITGYKPDVWLNRADWFITENEINERAKERTKAHLRGETTDGPIFLETYHADGRIIFLEIYESPIIKNGIVTGLQGVAHDITLRVRAENALRESEGKFKAITDNASDTILQCNEKGEIIYINRPHPGLSKEFILNSKVFDFVPAEQKPIVESALKKVFENGDSTVYETSGPGPFGEVRIYEVNASPVLKENQVTSAVFLARDITDRKEAEKKLNETLLNLKRSQEISHVGNWSLDLRSNKFSASEEALRMMGFPVDYQPLFEEVASLIHPEDRGNAREIMTHAIETGKSYSIEIRISKSDTGEEKHILSIGEVLLGKDEKPVQIFGINQDITDRKFSEKAISDSEKKYRDIFEANKDGISVFYINNDGTISGIADCNNYAAEMLGYKKEEIVGMHPTQIEVNSNPGKAKDRADKILSQGYAEFETEIMHKNGGQIPVEVKVVQIVYNNRPALMNIVRDITSRRKTENELRERERTLSTLIDNLPGFAYRCKNDNNWTMEFISEGCRQITGYAPEDFINNKKLSYNDIIAEEYKETVWKKWQENLKEKQKFEGEYSIITAEGQKRIIWERGQGIFSDNNELIYLEGFITDITERKKTEAKLEAESYRRKILFDKSPDGILIIDPVTTGFIEFNTAAHEQLGYTREEFEKITIKDVEALETPEEIKNRIKGVIETGNKEFETLQRTKNGELRNVNVKAHTIYINNKLIYECIWRDITEQKRAGEALRISEEKFSKAFRHAPMLITLTNLEDGKLIDVNDEFVKVSGFSREEAIGRTTIEIGWADGKERMTKVKDMKSGGTVLGAEINVTNKNGLNLTCLYSGEIIDVGGSRYLLSIAQDITGRKKTEKMLVESEQRYRSFFENDLTGDYLSTPEGVLIECNPSFAKILGYDSVEEIINLHTSVFYPGPADRNKFIEKLTNEKVIIDMEIDLVRKDGELINCVENVVGFFNESGELISFQGYLFDITESKKARQQLLKEKEWSDTIVKNAPNIIVGLGENSKIILFNKFAEQLTGYRADEVIGKEWIELFIPQDIKASIHDVWDNIVRERSIIQNYENSIITKSGEEKLISWNNSVLIENGEFKMVLSIGEDITDKKNIETALIQSEENYRKLVELSPDAILTHVDGIIQFVNNSSVRLFEADGKEDLIGKKIIELVHPDYRNIVTERIKNITENEFKAPILEEKLISIKDNTFDAEVSAVPISISGKNGVQVVARDITDRKQSEKALKESESNLKLSQEIGRIGHYTYDILSGYWTSSEALDEIFGIAEGYNRDVDGWTNLIHPDDREMMSSYLINHVLIGKNKFDREYRILNNKTNSVLWAHGIGILEFNEEGNPVKMFGTIQNVTERKLYEEDLRRYRNIVDSSHDGIAFLDKDYRYVIVNDVYEKLSGISRENFIGKSVSEYLGRDIFENVIKPQFDRCLNGELINYQDWFDYINAGRRYMDITYSPYRDSQNNIIGIVANSRDITDRKKIEEKIQFQARILDAVEQAVIATDPESKISYWNPFAEKLYGWTEEEVLGKTTLELIATEESLSYGKDIMAKLREGLSWSGEYTTRRKDGRTFPIQVSLTPVLTPKGKVSEIIGVSTDITERRKAEEVLKEMNYRMSLAADSAMFGIWDLNIIDNSLIWDKWMFNLYGVNPDQVEINYDFWKNHVHTDDVERVVGEVEKAIAGQKIFDTEFRILLPDGRIRYLKANASVIFDRNNKPLRMTGINYDITNIRLSEKALRESERRHRLLADNASDVIWTMDFEGRFTYISPSVEKLRGYSVEEVMKHTLDEALTPDSAEIAKETIRNAVEAIRSGRPFPDFRGELKQPCRDGSVIWTEASVTAMRDNSGEYIGLIGVTRDISERKKAEEALKESENIFRTYIKYAPVGILVADADGIHVDSNDYIEELLGYTHDEIIGTKTFDLVEESFREAGTRHFKNVVENGFARGEIQLRKKNGEIVWAVITASRISDKRFLAIFQDITETKKSQELIQSLADIVNYAPNSIVIHDFEGQMLYANSRTYEMHGYTKEEFLQIKLSDLDAPESAEKIPPRIKMMEEFGETSFEVHHYRKDHSLLPLLVHIKKINWFGSQAILSISTDISERLKIETELKESEERFKALHNASFGGIAIHDKGLILECNQGMSELTGYSLDELIGMNGLLLIAEKWRDFVMDKIVSGYEKPYEAMGVRKNGEEYYLRLEARNIPYKGKNVRTVEFRDITDRKLTDKKMRESEEKFRQIVETANEGIWSMDKDYNTTFVNQKMAAMLGYEPEEMIGRKVHSFMYEQDLSDHDQKMDERKKGRKGFYERKFRRKDGDIITVLVSSTALADNDGNFNGSFGMFTDITEMRKAEEMIKLNALQFKLLTETSLSGFWRVTSDTKIIDVNETYCRMSGYSREEILTMSINDLEIVESIAETRERMEKLLNTGYDRFETKHRCKDGSIIHLDASISFFKELSIILVFFINITERKKQEELINFQSRLRQLLIEISSSYINLPLKDIDGSINKTLAKMGQFVGADRAYIFDFDYRTGRCTNTYEWCGEGITPQISNLKDIPLAPVWIETFGKAQAIYIPDLYALPENDEARQVLEAQEIKSLIAVPMMSSGKCIGFIGLDSVINRHSYSDMEIQILKIFAEIQVNIIMRKTFEKDILEQMNELNRFNKLMVGREEKMIELKEEINKLLGQMGQPPKYKPN